VWETIDDHASRKHGVALVSRVSNLTNDGCEAGARVALTCVSQSKSIRGAGGGAYVSPLRRDARRAATGADLFTEYSRTLSQCAFFLMRTDRRGRLWLSCSALGRLLLRALRLLFEGLYEGSTRGHHAPLRHA